MTDGYAPQAIQSVLRSRRAYCKFLSANDTGATGGHQCGILVSRSAERMLFSHSLASESILKRTAWIHWQNGLATESCFTYYRSKNELRITRFGRDFPFLEPDRTGALFVLTQQDEEHYQGFFLETEADMEQFLDTFGITPAETNRLIYTDQVPTAAREQAAIERFIASLTVDFPTSEVMSAAAREIHNAVYGRLDHIQSNPDRTLIEWTNMEYTLFRSVEQARYGKAIARGFSSMDDFITMANMVLNRRKSRAGRSLEHHLAAIFDSSGVAYTPQAVTEGNKRPDFLFPSQAAYHDAAFPAERLISLSAKTTCKDRWRQIINEADRLRDRPKYLCTLQQGISPAQMDEMQTEQVILVVPQPYIKFFPRDRQHRIWTLSKFVRFVQETEGTFS